MAYATMFDPDKTQLGTSTAASSSGRDTRDGSVYVYKPELVLAVKVALATSRPLLLLGPPGSGKSSLAAFVARTMEWNYFEQVITSRTQAEDMLWNIDAVRRLGDAQVQRLRAEPEAYIEPKVLWWAFNPNSARVRGLSSPLPEYIREARPPGVLRGFDHPSVVLLDEIDKADPDVPNDLLVVLGSQQFEVAEIGLHVEPVHAPLIFITSNGERTLPKAFVRRCVIYELKQPDEEDLVKIASNHFPSTQEDRLALFQRLAKKTIALREERKAIDSRGPSTAEYLDAVRACIKFNITPDDAPLWNVIESAILAKRFQA